MQQVYQLFQPDQTNYRFKNAQMLLWDLEQATSHFGWQLQTEARQCMMGEALQIKVELASTVFSPTMMQ